MNSQILHIAEDMFLKFGFKSVTMDDLASAMSVSKKTIYEHFKNKSALIEAVAQNVKTSIHTEIDEVIALNLDPIHEMVKIKESITKRVRNENASPQYQLQKYYPKIHEKLKNSQVCKMDECCTNNVARGIQLGYYRKDLNIVFVVRSYISGMMNLKDQELFKSTDLSPKQLYEEFLIYHLRSITTIKGKKRLESLLNTN